MLPRTSENIERDRKVQNREGWAERINRWCEEQVANAIYIEDYKISPTNMEYQLGRKFTSSELEARLDKSTTKLIYETNPHNLTKKSIYTVRDGEKIFICAYENGWMPEHSVLRTRKEDYYPAIKHLDRKDLGDGIKKEVRIPWGEAIRGWRTVLVKLVVEGLITPAQAERIFGSDDRKEWAAHLGKQDIRLPW